MDVIFVLQWQDMEDQQMTDTNSVVAVVGTGMEAVVVMVVDTEGQGGTHRPQEEEDHIHAPVQGPQGDVQGQDHQEDALLLLATTEDLSLDHPIDALSRHKGSLIQEVGLVQDHAPDHGRDHGLVTATVVAAAVASQSRGRTVPRLLY